MNRTIKCLVIGGGICIILLLLFLVSSETFGAESNPTGNPLGGGAGYTRIISGTDMDVTYSVSTKDQLLAALKNAQPGEVVFVNGSAVIDMTGTPDNVIPDAVTLASDRGSNGSLGALIQYTYNNNGMYGTSLFEVGGNNVRITGLRLEGEMLPQDGTGNGEASYMRAIREQNKAGLEVDNCEIRGWAWSCITTANSTGTYIHHNYLHHNQARGEGYGADIYGGDMLVEANIFNYNRHDIAAGGYPGESYEARYNLVLGEGNAIGGHHFDVHAYPVPETNESIAGYEYKIHHNTFMVTSLPAIGIRAVPQKGVWIDHNKIQTSDDIYPVFQRGHYPGGVFCGFGRVYMTQNFIGTDSSVLILHAEGPIVQV
jgi:hypothetical protein